LKNEAQTDSCRGILADICNQVAAVTGSSLDFAVTQALTDAADDLLPCQAHSRINE
jgi:hypothetical protein